MLPHESPLSAERVQTDESLRLEREQADLALGHQLAAIDRNADVVINRARKRADEVVARLRIERAQPDRATHAERSDDGAVLASERDETDKDLLAERTKSDQAMRTRDDFLGIVSHDLRNMLHAVMGYSELTTRAVEDTQDHVAEVLRHGESIQRACARMDRLIGDLLDVASIAAGALAITPELVDPAEVVAEAVDSFMPQAAANNVSLTAGHPTPGFLAEFDAARVLQVLTNLLSNAIKFTPANGKVSVRVDRLNDDVMFTVSDTGPGIPAGMLQSVFVRFLQLAKNDLRSVGLGLYISKCIVERHGGRIWAESTLGQGSTFRFTLPLRAVASAARVSPRSGD